MAFVGGSRNRKAWVRWTIARKRRRSSIESCPLKVRSDRRMSAGAAANVAGDEVLKRRGVERGGKGNSHQAREEHADDLCRDARSLHALKGLRTFWGKTHGEVILKLPPPVFDPPPLTRGQSKSRHR